MVTGTVHRVHLQSNRNMKSSSCRSHAFTKIWLWMNIHSFHSLSYNRSVVSSKVSSPQVASIRESPYEQQFETRRWENLWQLSSHRSNHKQCHLLEYDAAYFGTAEQAFKGLLTMATEGSSQTSVHFQQITHHIPANSNLHRPNQLWIPNFSMTGQSFLQCYQPY